MNIDRSEFIFLGVFLPAGFLAAFAAAAAPQAFLLLCATAALLGVLSGIPMMQYGTRKTAVMHIAGIPLFFILGFNLETHHAPSMELIIALYMLYALAYLSVVISAYLIEKNEFERMARNWKSSVSK